MPNGLCGVWDCFEEGDYVVSHKIDDEITVFSDVCKKHYEIITKKKADIED